MYRLIKINFVLLILIGCLFYNNQVRNFLTFDEAVNKTTNVLSGIEKTQSIKTRLCIINQNLLDSVYDSDLDYLNSVISYSIVSFTKNQSDSLYQTTLNKLTEGKKIYYFTQWKNSLEQRGFFTDITSLYPHVKYCEKKFNAYNSDTSLFVKKLEIYLSSTELNYLPTYIVENIESEFHDGDIIAFVSKEKNRDVDGVCIVKKINGKPFFYYLDNSAVHISTQTLYQHLVKNKNSIQGILILNINHIDY